MSEEITISKNKVWKYLSLILIIAIVITLFVNYSGSSSGGSDVGDSSSVVNGNAQKIVLSYKNYNYYPNTIRAKVGIPVNITLDKSVQGCFRELVISDFGIDEYSSTPSHTINFIPDKIGIFKFRCGMGMGSGTLIVE